MPKNQSNAKILFVIVDEMRYDTVYETEELKQWKKDNLIFQEEMAKRSTVFHNHYTNTCACVPARATLQTGTYPSVHGCTNTDGIAKEDDDPLMTWLPKFTVPTIGNYLKNEGFKSYLKGKWHISDASLKGNSGDEIPSYDYYGEPIDAIHKLYLRKNILEDYGYDGWIGPEPHGKLSLNSASSVSNDRKGRDEDFIRQALETLDSLKSKDDPWYLCLNMVDPHDIALMGRISSNITASFEFEIDETLPENLFTDQFIQSNNDTLDTKPITQSNYQDIYPQAFQPIVNTDRYYRYYYTLMKRVNQQLMTILQKMDDCFPDAHIIFTSDHGDLLGAHGLYQKWHQAYQESIHVPMMISSPKIPSPRNVYEFTSHIDILPTILDLADVNTSRARRRLRKNFSLAMEPIGDSMLLLNDTSNWKKDFVYFYTEDNPTQGDNRINVLGNEFSTISEPSCVEAIITYVDNVKWKLTRYYSLKERTMTINPDLMELYNLDDDPIEINNLIKNPNYADLINTLFLKLVTKTCLYRKTLNVL